ncbi:MAG: Outer membrane protein assembly factor BamD [Verrucomicrobiae bacterium]|nr:Outer membrane protein assembly factor BamD [Verrucomicrobiae bacterium]
MVFRHLPRRRDSANNARHMKCLWPILTLLLIAAAPPDETRQFRMAQAALDDKLYDVAERQLQEFIRQFPASERADNAAYLLGRAQVGLGKWPLAVKTLQDALARWPDKRTDAIHFWLGEAHSGASDYAAAVAQYSEVVEKHRTSPHFTAALFGLAYAQLKQGQFAAASDALDQLAKTQPKGEAAFDADLLRAQLHLARQEAAKAEAVLDGITQRAGTTRSFYRANYWLGESLQRRKDFTNALTRYAVVTTAFKDKPNKPVDSQLAAEAWYGAGWTQWQMGQFTNAADAFNAALTNAVTAPLKRDALLKLAESQIRAGKITEGVTRLEEFLTARPNDPLADEVQLAIGDLLFGRDDPARALEEYLQLIKNFPQSPVVGRAYAQAGWCAWQLKQIADALNFFEQSATHTPSAPVIFKIADCQAALGQYTNAAASYRRVLAEFPATPDLDRALFQLGETYRRLDDPLNAMAAFQRLVSEKPRSDLAPQAQYSIGQLLAGQGQAPAARNAFTAVTTRFPTSVWASNAALAVGESYVDENKYDRAIAEFDKLTGGGFDTELAQQAFYSRGRCYALTGKRDKTLTEFLDFLKTHPQATLAPRIQYWVADEFLRQRDYLKAQAQFQSLAETYPHFVDADAALYFAGRAAYARQDYKTAVELYEALLKKFPQSNWRCEARFGQGDALSELGQFDDALLVLQSLTKDFPDCRFVSEAFGRKGDCQFTLTRYDDALASYQKALAAAKTPDMRLQAFEKIGKTYEALKKFDDAVQAYAAAVYEATAGGATNEPPERFWSCRAARAAANLKEQQNQWRDAITFYEKMASHCPDLKALAEDRIRKIRVQHPETLFQR